MDRVGTLPSVTKVSLSSDMPLDGNASAVFYTPEGQNQTGEQKRPRAYVHRVSPDFFATLRIPMQRGRGFAAEEMSAKVNRVVISEDVARRYWAGQDPLGRRLKFGPPDSQNPWLEVIGVVGDVKYRGLPQNPTPDPDLYLPLSEQRAQYSLAVRSSGKPEQLISAVTAEIRALDPGIAVSQISTVSDLVAARMTTARFARTLVALFAGMALLLALVGMYALISYIVSERTREIGIRLALGAEPKDIFARVIGQSLTLAGIGIAFGLMLALGAGRVLASLLFEVSSANPLVLGAVAFLVLITAVVASAMPARRATQVDPMVALRYE
jgi:predicted permease